MKNIHGAFRDSIELFISNPKLIVPKLIVSLLYGVIIIFTAQNTIDAFVQPSIDVLRNLVVIFFATLAVVVADIVLSSMYPFIVQDLIKHKKAGLSGAFWAALSKAFVIVPAYLAVLLVFVIVTAIIEFVLFLAMPENFLLVAPVVDLVAVFAAVFLFYFLFPVAIFEKKGIMESLKGSISISMSKKSEVAQVTVLSFIVSGVSFAIGFALDFFPQNEQTWIFWAVFVFLRFLTAYIYAYLYVLNPVFYLELVKK